MLRAAVDGLQLLWHSDIVVSGGGTMNREAALLGVPTFSIFTGRRPYLDTVLQKRGRLKFIESASDVSKIPLVKRTIPASYVPFNRGVAARVTQQLIGLQESLHGHR